jgi:uncharacterized protein YndB with AHSA1/START domain
MTANMRTRRATTILERTYKASLEDVWSLWTTKDGFESWWGPGGFKTTVHKLDLKPGGRLLYTMTAVGAPQIEFMKKAGMPLSTDNSLTFDEIVPRKRLVFTSAIDFVPGVAPYDAETIVQLNAKDGEVRMILTLETLHDADWTRNARMGWESQLERVPGALAAK